MFYTDGLTVWNQMHEVMENGENLGGHPSSTHSALIVPRPQWSNQFYIFTTHWNEGSTHELKYSLVDMNGDGGLGHILPNVKNKVLFAPVCEKLAATPNHDNTSIWLLSHELFSNQYLAFQIKDTGISVSPVISATGFNTPHGGGQMKITRDGTKIAAATFSGHVEVTQFDRMTGVVSNPVTLDGIIAPYGIEFSSNSEKLYYSSLVSGLWQLDVSVFSQPDILLSHTQIFNDSSAFLQGMQLAPNGRIYVANLNQNQLGTIRNPNMDAANVNFFVNGLSLDTNQVVSSLPSFMTAYLGTLTAVDVPLPELSLDIYPNPATTFVRIRTGKKHTDLDVMIYNANGSLLLQKKLGPEEDRIELNRYPEGVYLIKIQLANKKTMTQKIVITR